ncbi:MULTISPECIES: MerR family transcriptional regulator [unclassified Butyrivibrio]|uniref:MerR family transcriptional regulator n=1 Tax=unclassified Butyrivibrio TaxID=2639466 RepID=UPI0003B6F0C7|nr:MULTISPECIES: MerR family transcriptional regulator [unclassified Butyrivibrio]SEM15516.1 DNA-binding transcriptional regulator, MerR family [Butyrivibrio sp. ob235]
MKISEAASAAGLDVSSVRFYERKGLINPERGEDSNYRDYTPEDIERLKKIVLFRKIDMPVEDIRKMLDNEQDIGELLGLQMQRLEEDRLKVEGSIQLCKKMLEDGYEESDTDKYISYVAEAESRGQRFPDILPVLDEISLNSGFESLVGYPIFFNLMKNALCRRLLAVGIVIIMVIFPLIQLILNIIRLINGQGNLMMSLIWIIYSIMLISAFVNILHKTKIFS